MRPDILALHKFYASPLGGASAAVINEQLSKFWPNGQGMLQVGIGFTLPYLDHLTSLGAECHAMMPAAQGVSHWPDIHGSRTALVNEYHLPFADSSVDRVLAVHALEHANNPAHFLREIWRILAPGGQVVVVVPNRRRTWSALDTTPFGHGRPYSKGQLYHLMNEQMLPPDGWETALMLPPFNVPGTARMMKSCERAIRFFGKNLGGALLVCARKQVYGALLQPKAKRKAIPAMVNLSTPHK